jgi:hypothetical protein
MLMARRSHWQRYRTLYLLLALCVTPVVASYLLYYVWPPTGRTNYGELIDPQRPLPALDLRELDGTPVAAAKLRGQWLMVMADRADCAAACQQKLWQMRQIRTATGKERDRIDRVFLVLDEAPLATLLLREYEGTLFLRARREQLQAFLPLAPGMALEAPIWLIDPLGNLMLRWPPQAEPRGIKRDLDKVLKASRIG